MSNLPTEVTEKGLRVKASPYFKLKRKAGKNYLAIELEKAYGFIPKTIIVERDISRSNTVRVNAVMPQEEIEKEDSLLAQREKEREKIREALKADFEKNKKMMEEKGKEVSA